MEGLRGKERINSKSKYLKVPARHVLDILCTSAQDYYLVKEQLVPNY